MRTGWPVLTWIFFGNQKSWLRKWAVFRSAWLCASWLSFIALGAKFMDLLTNWDSFSKKVSDLTVVYLEMKLLLLVLVTQKDFSDQVYITKLFTFLGRLEDFPVTIYRSFAGNIFYRIRLSDFFRYCAAHYFFLLFF